MKKSIVYICIVCVLLVVIISGFFYINNQKRYDSDSLIAMPIDSDLVFEINSVKDLYDALSSKEGMYKEIKQSGIFDDYYKVYSLANSIVENKGVDIDIDKSITCAAKLMGKHSIDLLYSIEIENNSELKGLKSLISECFSSYSLKKKNYAGEEVFIYTKGTDRYVVSYVKGLFLMSKTCILVENAIRQINSSNNLLSTPSFENVHKTVDENSDIVLYINNSNSSNITKLCGDSRYFSFLNKIDHWGAWTGLDIDFDEESISSNGFSSSSNNKFELFDVLSNQKAIKPGLLEHIPSGTASFSIFCLSNIKKYREDMIKYRGKLGRLNKYRRNILDLDKKFSCKFEDKFYSFFAGEAAQLSLSINSIAVNDNKISIFKTIGNEKVSTVMKNMLKSVAEKENRSLSYYSKKVKIDRELSYNVYRLPFNDIPYRIMGDLFYEAPSKYFVIVDNNLVFGGSIKVLSEYLQSYSLNKSILDDSDFEDCGRRFSDKCNYMFYANMYSSFPLIRSYFNLDKQITINKHKDSFSRFNFIGYQLSSANSMVYNNLFALYSEEIVKKPQTEWESGLEADVAIKPAIVRNHKSGETEILVQDIKNNVYLINSLGRILWKQPIDGRINSSIHQVDVYRNRKLQYLFSTKKKMYILDRNGNNVGKFPIAFKSPSNYGVSVFDYDKSRNYRLFVPCENKKIYLYDISGKIVKGWSFKKSENNITSKVHHYRVGDKDYIVFKDKFKLYILDRRGKSRAKSNYNKLSNNEIVFVPGKQAHMLVSDMKGSVYNVYFNGKVKKMYSYNDISGKHKFTAADIDNDGLKDFIFVDKNRLSVYSKKSKIIDVELSGKSNYVPSIYSFSKSKKMIGIVDSENSKVHLFDKEGNDYSGFPVSGNNQFSITFMRGKTVGFYMFVGSTDSGLYKYRVQK